MAEPRQHEVALSFTAEQREYVEQVASILQEQGVRVFYDDFEYALRYEKHLHGELHAAFVTRADCVVVFISSTYVERAWPQHDRASILSRLIRKRPERVLTVRLDQTPVPDLPTSVAFDNADKAQWPDHVAELILDKLSVKPSPDCVATAPPPQATSLIGEVAFDYSDHDGRYVIGRGSLQFETCWSKASNTSIHVLHDPPSIDGVALARGYRSLAEVMNARSLDYTSRIRTPQCGEIVVLRNTSGCYAAIHVLQIKDDTRGDEEDELRFRYAIQANGTDNFTDASIAAIHVRGFRSLDDVAITNLPNVTVMIGTNGAGKSNVMRLFEMLSRMLKDRRLADFVARHGGADDQLFGGRKVTSDIDTTVVMRTDAGRYEYRFGLEYADPDCLSFASESFRFAATADGDADWQDLGSGHREAKLVEAAHRRQPPTVNARAAAALVHLLGNCMVYQFHDTSRGSNFKVRWDAEDHDRLRPDGANLASILLRLMREDIERYESICEHIRRALPVFDRFDIDESYGKVLLRWTATGTDKALGAHLTSDGSLRFFALTTLLNLPRNMLADVILLDEPELGLHPAALALIGDMINTLGRERQIIVATQSPLLVDAFSLDQIIVLDLLNGRTVARQLAKSEYRRWLEDYTTGELWQKNLIGGRP